MSEYGRHGFVGDAHQVLIDMLICVCRLSTVPLVCGILCEPLKWIVSTNPKR